MPQDEMEAGISVKWEETSEEPFRPKAGTTIVAELVPEKRYEATVYSPEYTDFYRTLVPPYIPAYVEVPEFEAPEKELIINIETTRVKPWEGKVICIGVLDPNKGAPEAINFIRETEEETLNEFLEWFEATGYSVLIGYNVSFDYRFLYALMQKYRKSVSRWPKMELYDLMQQQKQVKQALVFGYNPTGKLEDWATLLLGTKPYAEQTDVYKWWKEKNLDEIVNFNSDKLVKSYYLWVLGKLVAGTIPGTEVLGRPGTPTEATPEGTVQGSSAAEVEIITVQCSKCLQGQEMPKTAKVINCFVCGTPIANPAL